MAEKNRDTALEAPQLVRRHLLAGWLLLLVFLGLGTLLEAFHGLKIGWYLNLANQTRRLMWTLAHAHGVLLGLVNIAFAVTLHVRGLTPERRNLASASLLGASVGRSGGGPRVPRRLQHRLGSGPQAAQALERKAPDRGRPVDGSLERLRGLLRHPL